MNAKRPRRPNGEAGIRWNDYKKRWVYPYWVTNPDGSKVRREVTGTDKADVIARWEKAKADAYAAAQSGDPLPDKRVKMTTLFDNWLAAGCPSTKGKPAPVTVAYNRRMIDLNLRPTLGEIPVKDFDKWAVSELFETLVAKGHGKSTLGHLKSILGRVIWWAEDGKAGHRVAVPLRARSAASGAVVPKDAAATEKAEALSEAEVAAMLAAFEGHPYQAPLALMAHTGLRPAEVFGLQWGDWEQATDKLKIVRTDVKRDGEWVYGTVKSKASAREIDLHPRAVAVLRTRFAASPGLPQAPIFPGRWFSLSGLQDIDRFGQDVKTRTGHKPYALRHTVASKLLAAGWPVPDVAQYMGHTPATLLAVYAHALPAAPDQAQRVAQAWA